VLRYRTQLPIDNGCHIADCEFIAGADRCQKRQPAGIRERCYLSCDVARLIGCWQGFAEALDVVETKLGHTCSIAQLLKCGWRRCGASPAGGK
jgi:hypothetical protein